MPLDTALIRPWEIARAAARFSKGIDEELPVLTRFLEQRLAEAS